MGTGEQAVVDLATMAVHGFDNVYVADSSVVPTDTRGSAGAGDHAGRTLGATYPEQAGASLSPRQPVLRRSARCACCGARRFLGPCHRPC
jgi:hypothetical protein